MKKLKLISLFLLLNSNLFGQITLEQSYTGDFDEQNFGLVMLENSGKKYYFYDKDSYILNLYNLNHSLYKSINFDITSIIDTSIYVSSDLQQITYITENLFDLDNEIEFLFSYYYYDASWNALEGTLIFNEDGTIIFNEPNFTGDFESAPNTNLRRAIENTENGTKMMLQGNGIINIYNLPGSLPCTNLCADSLTNGLKLPEIENEINTSISAYPNPTTDYITIEYDLPQGINSGEIVLYDLHGNEIQKYQVDVFFDNLKISTSDIPQGVYLFNLKTSLGISEGKRIIKIN